MSLIPLLLKELKDETAITRKFLAQIPDDKFFWKPHEKSMSIKQLSGHLAELPGWVSMALHTDGLDFEAGDYKPTDINTSAELVKLLDENLANSVTALQNAKEADLDPIWTMRMGEKILAKWTKYEVIRHALAQQIHHRAQLGVDFRLLDIPVPSTYGPTADDQSF